jgi:hypothetical protein
MPAVMACVLPCILHTAIDLFHDEIMTGRYGHKPAEV